MPNPPASQRRNRTAKNNANANKRVQATRTRQAGSRKPRGKTAGGGASMQRTQLELHSAQIETSVSSFFRFHLGSLPTSLVVAGRDLARVALAASSASGLVVNTAADVVPDVGGASLCTRWTAFAGLFQKWRLRRLRATLVSNQGTTTVGNNFIAFQTDPDAAAPTTAEGIMRLEGAAMGNAYANIQAQFDCGTQLKWLTTKGSVERATEIAGMLNVMTSGYSSAVIVGTVVVDYEIEFADII